MTFMTTGKWRVWFVIGESNVKTTCHGNHDKLYLYFVQAPIYSFLLFDIANKGKKNPQSSTFIVQHVNEKPKHHLVLFFTGKRRLEQYLGDLRLARVRQAANPRNPLDFLAIKT